MFSQFPVPTTEDSWPALSSILKGLLVCLPNAAGITHRNTPRPGFLSPEVSWGQLIQVLRDLVVCLLNASDLPHLGLQVSNLLKN